LKKPRSLKTFNTFSPFRTAIDRSSLLASV
jgi:hypothetical protein